MSNFHAEALRSYLSVREGIISANEAGLKAVIAGPIERQSYFEQAIQPLIARGGAEYVGSVCGAQSLVNSTLSTVHGNVNKDRHEAFRSYWQSNRS